MNKLNNQNFDQSISTGLNLVKFSASWCGPCKAYAPVFQKLSESVNGAGFFEISLDDGPEIQDIANKYEIKAIPTILIFKDGIVVEKITGLKPLNTLIELVQKYQ